MLISDPSRYGSVDLQAVMSQARRCLDCPEPQPCLAACPEGADILASMRVLAGAAVVDRARSASDPWAQPSEEEAFVRSGIDRSYD